MKNIFYSVPVVGVALFVSSFALANGCEYPEEIVNSETGQIEIVCPEYDYFQQEYGRISNILKDTELQADAFVKELSTMDSAEKADAYTELLNTISWLKDDIRHLRTSFDTNTEEEKKQVLELAKQQKALAKKAEGFKKQYEIFTADEQASLDAVAASFAVSTELLAETKELYALMEADMTAKEKKQASRALKISDVLYGKLKKKNEAFKSLIVNRPPSVNPWILENQYNMLSQRLERSLDVARERILGN